MRWRRAIRVTELANQLGDGPTVVIGDLIGWRRGMYDAQLTMWAASVEYARCAHLNIEYGVPVPTEVRLAWEQARVDWQPWLVMLAAPKHRRTEFIAPRRDYL
jgi:hypothetical protein